MQVASKLCLPVTPLVALCIHLGTDFVYCFVFMQKIFLQTVTWIKAGGSSDAGSPWCQLRQAADNPCSVLYVH